MRVQFGTEFAISISGQDERVSLAPGFLSVLSVKFLDIETEHVLSFTTEMAVEIVNCVLTPPTFINLVVHCHAGTSRSAAVTLAAHAMPMPNSSAAWMHACYAITLVVRLLAEKSGCQIPIPARSDLSRAAENLFCTYLVIHTVIVF